MVRVKSSQKTFTEDEVSRLTGICLDHLRALARNRHLGRLTRAAQAAGAEAGVLKLPVRSKSFATCETACIAGARAVTLAGGAIKARTLTLAFSSRDLLAGHLVKLEIGGLDATLALGKDGLEFAGRPLLAGGGLRRVGSSACRRRRER